MNRPAFPPEANAPGSPGIGQVTLGLVIVGQLLFLFAANLSGLLVRFAPDFAERPVAETVAGVTTHWSQLTNQPQNWSLFAPEPETTSAFFYLEGQYDSQRFQAGYQLFSEPDDINRYLHIGRSRLRCYESALSVSLLIPPGKTREEMEDPWRAAIFEIIRRRSGPMRAYLRWRLQRELPANGLPERVIVVARIWRIQPPSALTGGWRYTQFFGSDPVIARWLPHAEKPDSLPIEAYNPVFREFDYLPRRPRR